MKNPSLSKIEPTILVIFGATGDLMTKKIVPALWFLFREKKLPKDFRVIGFSRRELDREEFLKHIRLILKRHRYPSGPPLKNFLKLFSFTRGFFDEKAAYARLRDELISFDEKKRVCSNKLFYLAVPPRFFKPILENLNSTGLVRYLRSTGCWVRVLVEKPGGRDFESARRLNQTLSRYFKEKEIYRIDHYLAKEMLQNVMAFRFSNNFLEHRWDNSFVESIQIRLLETLGAEGRGEFYDPLGALRDVGQNHLLEMLALVTMEPPAGSSSEEPRKKRAEILKTLKLPNEKEIKNFTYRAQYEGYREIKGVRPNSKTETYFKVRAFLAHPKWRGVPVVLEAGKRLEENRKEIILNLKHFQNRIIFRIEPREEIVFEAWTKRPGLESKLEKRNFRLALRERRSRAQYVEEYKKLLFDVLAGDQTLFLAFQEVRPAWRFVDRIRKAWDKNLVPLKFYKPGEMPR